MSTSQIQLNDQLCIIADPDPYPEAAGLANGYWCPLGMESGIGYCLLLRSQLEGIDTESSVNFSLYDGSSLLQFKKLWVVSAIGIGNGTGDNPNQAMLVRLGDPRFLLKKFSGTVNTAFNLRSFASLRASGDTDVIVAKDCYPESLNTSGTVLYTWTTMLQELWALLPSGIAGAWPGLPDTIPDYKPENYNFVGESAWQVINDLLSIIQCAIVYNPFTNAFSIVDLTESQDGLTGLINSAGMVVKDANPLTPNATWIPDQISTYFIEKTQNYGTQYDAVLDKTIGNYLFEAVKSFDSSTDAGGEAGTNLDIHDERNIFQEDDTPITDDRQTDADALAVRWEEMQTNSETFAHVCFQGLTKFVPGSQVKVAYWHNLSGGTITEIMRFPGMPQAKLAFDQQCEQVSEPMRHIDIGGKHAPVYPLETQWVKIDDGSSSDGAVIQADSYGFFPGKVQRFSPGTSAITKTALDSCIIWITDNNEASKAIEFQGSYYLARLCGGIDNGAGTKPLLIISRTSTRSVIGKLDSSYSTGAHTVSVWKGAAGSEADSTINITAYPWTSVPAGMMPVASGSKVICWRANMLWYFIPIMDLSAAASYSSGVKQYLTHDTSGVLTWQGKATC